MGIASEVTETLKRCWGFSETIITVRLYGSAKIDIGRQSNSPVLSPVVKLLGILRLNKEVGLGKVPDSSQNPQKLLPGGEGYVTHVGYEDELPGFEVPRQLLFNELGGKAVPVAGEMLEPGQCCLARITVGAVELAADKDIPSASYALEHPSHLPLLPGNLAARYHPYGTEKLGTLGSISQYLVLDFLIPALVFRHLLAFFIEDHHHSV